MDTTEEDSTMKYLKRISAIFLVCSLSLFAMAGAGEGKIHDHQTTKDHIKRDKNPSPPENSDCGTQSAVAADRAEIQNKSADGRNGECDPAQKEKLHDHRKSKNL